MTWFELVACVGGLRSGQCSSVQLLRIDLHPFSICKYVGLRPRPHVRGCVFMVPHYSATESAS